MHGLGEGEVVDVVGEGGKVEGGALLGAVERIEVERGAGSVCREGV